MELMRICPCCNNKEAKKLFDVGFVDNGCLPTRYNIVSCTECGFTFADSNATQSDYNNYYNTFNDYSDDVVVKYGVELQGTPYESIYLGTKDLIDKSDNIIDLGCGSGPLLSIFQNNGYRNLYGLDPSHNAINMVINRGIDGGVANIFDPVRKEHKHNFDVVLSTCVIEHIFDLNKYICQIKEYLKNQNSKIVLSLPAVEGFREYTLTKANYFNQEHINYFSVESLDNIMHKHDLKRINNNEFFYCNNEKYILAVYSYGKEKGKVKRDLISEESILLYLERYEKRNRELIDKINDVEKLNNIVVFGVGSLVSQILYERPKLIDKIDCFIDNNVEKQKRLFAGKKVYPASELLNMVGKQIVVCSMFYSDDIETQIREMGCKNEIIKLIETNNAAAKTGGGGGKND